MEEPLLEKKSNIEGNEKLQDFLFTELKKLNEPKFKKPIGKPLKEENKKQFDRELEESNKLEEAPLRKPLKEENKKQLDREFEEFKNKHRSFISRIEEPFQQCIDIMRKIIEKMDYEKQSIISEVKNKVEDFKYKELIPLKAKLNKIEQENIILREKLKKKNKPFFPCWGSSKKSPAVTGVNKMEMNHNDIEKLKKIMSKIKIEKKKIYEKAKLIIFLLDFIYIKEKKLLLEKSFFEEKYKSEEKKYKGIVDECIENLHSLETDIPESRTLIIQKEENVKDFEVEYGVREAKLEIEIKDLRKKIKLLELEKGKLIRKSEDDHSFILKFEKYREENKSKFSNEEIFKNYIIILEKFIKFYSIEKVKHDELISKARFANNVIKTANREQRLLTNLINEYKTEKRSLEKFSNDLDKERREIESKNKKLEELKEDLYNRKDKEITIIKSKLRVAESELESKNRTLKNYELKIKELEEKLKTKINPQNKLIFQDLPQSGNIDHNLEEKIVLLSIDNEVLVKKVRLIEHNLSKYKKEIKPYVNSQKILEAFKEGYTKASIESEGEKNSLNFKIYECEREIKKLKSKIEDYENKEEMDKGSLVDDREFEKLKKENMDLEKKVNQLKVFLGNYGMTEEEYYSELTN